jgi:hypothetical protein
VVKEIRQIDFSLGDLSIALEGRAKALKITPPTGSLLGISHDEDHKAIAIRFSPGEGEPKVMRYKYETVAAAVVYYCRHMKIPLPSRADKVLTVYKDHIQVRIEYPARKLAGWAFQTADHDKA